MFKKFDYLDNNYPFKYNDKYNIYQILKNTKKLCKDNDRYNDYSSKYTKMTTRSTYIKPEVKEYPILYNSEMISITKKCYNTSRPESANEIYIKQPFTSTNIVSEDKFVILLLM